MNNPEFALAPHLGSHHYHMGASANSSSVLTPLSVEGGVVVVRPSWALTRRWESSPEQVTAREGKRKGGRATDRLKEAWNETVG